MGELAKKRLRIKRKKRIRAKISGSSVRPRLTVSRSAKHLYAQVVDDEAGKTLVFVHSFANKSAKAGIAECEKLGKEIARKCQASNISKVVFDKNGYAYHGRVKAFAEGARAGGIEF